MSERNSLEMTFEGGTEKRVCPDCKSAVKVPKETPYVWCADCSDGKVAMQPVSERTEQEDN